LVSPLFLYWYHNQASHHNTYFIFIFLSFTRQRWPDVIVLHYLSTPTFNA
jgi:hypothetical protein